MMTKSQKVIYSVIIILLVVVAAVVLTLKYSPLKTGSASSDNNFGHTTWYATTTNSGSAPVRVLPQDYGRRYAIVTNNSSFPIYLYLASSSMSVASATAFITSLNGVLVNASSSYEICSVNLFTGEIWASSTASGVKISATESD